MKNSLSTWYDGKTPVLKFACKFGALMLLFYGVSVTPYCERVFWPANLQANAWVANVILHALQQHTSLTGDTIVTGNYVCVVKRGCDATEPVCLLAAAAIAFPAPFRRKVIGILAGTLLLLAINQLRVVALFFVGRDYPRFFDALHLTLLPAVFVVLSMLIWVGWVEWTLRCDRLKTNVKKV